MTDKLVVEGVRGLDGEYPCDLVGMLQVNSPDTITSREAHRIKEMAGVRAGELQEALAAGDNDVLVALAAIVLTRAGRTVNLDALWDAPLGAVTFDIGDRQEEEAGDPKAETLTATPSPNGGGSSPQTSDLPANAPSPTGHHDSETSATSPPPSSASSR